MKVDAALILSAGQGTRMGKIGRELPKILWPVFGKTLLELQVLYLREMKIENIYINLSHDAEKIQNKLKNNNVFHDVTFLVEDQLLGVGGAIHNLAIQDELKNKKNLLIINADQFCFFDEKIWNEAYLKLSNSCSSLFATWVSSKHKYNEVILKDEYLVDIIKSDESKIYDHITYGGFGYIDLNYVRDHHINGRSDFFKTVAPYGTVKVPMTILPKNLEYWDFGTKERYYYQMMRLKNAKSSEFYKFLLRSTKGVISNPYFSNGNVDGLILDNILDFEIPSFHFLKYQNIIEEINLDESLL